MKILNPIVRVCADCRVVRVRGRVILKHYGSQRCASRRAGHNGREQR